MEGGSVTGPGVLGVKSLERMVWLVRVPSALQPILMPSNGRKLEDAAHSHMILASASDQRDMEERSERFKSVASAAGQTVGTFLHAERCLELSDPPPGVAKTWIFQNSEISTPTFWVSQGEKGDITKEALAVEAKVIIKGTFVPSDPSYMPMHALSSHALQSSTLLAAGPMPPPSAEPTPVAHASQASSDYKRYERGGISAVRLAPAPKSRIVSHVEDYQKPLYKPVDPESLVPVRKENKKGLTSDQMGDAIFDLFREKPTWKIKEVQTRIRSNNNKKVREVLAKLCDLNVNGLFWTLKPEFCSIDIKARYPQRYTQHVQAVQPSSSSNQLDDDSS